MAKLGRKIKEHKIDETTGTELKHCSMCKDWIDINLFYKSKWSVDGLHNMCKQCNSKNAVASARRNTVERNKRRRGGENHTLRGIKEHMLIDGVEHKECFKCKTPKILEQFYKTQRNWDHISDMCRECNSKTTKIYHENNKDKARVASKKYRKFKMKTDPMFRLVRNLRNRVWYALVRGTKSAHTLELLGCDVDFLKEHLEKQFTEGMTWENYGKWHVDHILPCESFNLMLPEEQRRCFNWANLQPLWEKDNLSKHIKIDWARD